MQTLRARCVLKGIMEQLLLRKDMAALMIEKD